MALTQKSANIKDLTSGTNATLEHRHFAFIAATISQIDNDAERLRTALLFAGTCRYSNTRFDRQRFLKARNVVEA